MSCQEYLKYQQLHLEMNETSLIHHELCKEAVALSIEYIKELFETSNVLSREHDA